MIAYSRLSCNQRADLGGKSLVDMMLLECPPTNLINTIKAVGGFGVAIIIPILVLLAIYFLVHEVKMAVLPTW